jgi:hypothetical protein
MLSVLVLWLLLPDDVDGLVPDDEVDRLVPGHGIPGTGTHVGPDTSGIDPACTPAWRNGAPARTIESDTTRSPRIDHRPVRTDVVRDIMAAPPAATWPA